MEPAENNEETVKLKNIVYNLVMEKELTEDEKRVVEKVVEEKNYGSG